VSHAIAIVGASARAAAFSARRAGLAPIAADLFADADLRHLCPATRIENYPDGLLAWLRSARPAAWMYTGAIENHPTLVEELACVAPLWGNHGNALRRVRSPAQLAEALRAAGLLFPDTRPTPAGLPADGSWLAKFCRGAGGSGVSEFNTNVGSTTGPPRGPGDLVYQQRIAGTPCCALFVAHQGAATLLGVTLQLIGQPWLGAGPFHYCGSIGPWAVNDFILATILSIGTVLAERFSLSGLFGVDLMIHGQEVWTIEVNPRYTASTEIFERSTGVAALSLHAAACRGEAVDDAAIARVSPAVHGKAILFAMQDVTIPTEFAAWAVEQALATPWPALADVPPAGAAIPRGRPILTLFAEGTNPADVEQRLQRRATDVENELLTRAG
jgi:uncharacterized protein